MSDRAADRAQEACRQIARNRGWREVRDRRNANERVVVAMQGQREGDSRERRCTFDTRTGQARFDDQ